MDAGTGLSDARADPGPGAGYDFHDPAFVTWWLNSLYLLPLDDQVAVAERLLSAVHAPGSRREVEAFLAVQRLEIDSSATSGTLPTSLTLRTGELRWRSTLGELWRARPWLTGIGLVAFALLVLKGVWSLGRYGLNS